MSWHQNGPGSKGYYTGSPTCDQEHEQCMTDEFFVVKPVPAHLARQYDENERYFAERRITHRWEHHDTWVRQLGTARTQAEAKEICMRAIGAQYGGRL